MSDKFEEIDLGEFDAEYAGEKVRVLVNPTRGFRAEYNSACANAIFGTDDQAFTKCLAIVLGCTEEGAVQRINALPADVSQWLFFYTIDNFDGEKFGTTIPPHLYQVWDDWVMQRVKARAARLPASAQPASELQAAT